MPETQVATCGSPSCSCFGGSCTSKNDESPGFVETVRAMMARDGIDLDGLKERIAAIDLSWVKRKIMDPREGKGWNAEKTAAVERRYRRFLLLFTTSDTIKVVPTMDIDAFWHQHILDTRAYQADCARVFSSFLHHFPYFGMRGEDDAAHLQSSFDETAALYSKTFGESYFDSPAN